MKRPDTNDVHECVARVANVAANVVECIRSEYPGFEIQRLWGCFLTGPLQLQPSARESDFKRLVRLLKWPAPKEVAASQLELQHVAVPVCFLCKGMGT